MTWLEGFLYQGSFIRCELRVKRCLKECLNTGKYQGLRDITIYLVIFVSVLILKPNQPYHEDSSSFVRAPNGRYVPGATPGYF